MAARTQTGRFCAREPVGGRSSSGRERRGSMGAHARLAAPLPLERHCPLHDLLGPSLAGPVLLPHQYFMLVATARATGVLFGTAGGGL